MDIAKILRSREEHDEEDEHEHNAKMISSSVQLPSAL